MNDDPASLSNLHDIVTPADVSWWPLAPGWIILAFVAIVAAIYYAYRFYKAWRANTYRRDALRLLTTAESSTQVAEILRRTALVVSSRGEISSLQGDSWVEWLDQHTPNPAPDSIREMLTQSIYQPTPLDSDLPALRQFAADWISHHPSKC